MIFISKNKIMDNKYLTCPFCGKKYKFCTRHTKYCEKRSEFIEKNFDEMLNLYVKDEYSLVMLSKKYEIPYSLVVSIFKEKGVKMRSLKESVNTKTRKENYTSTCMKHWGTPHNFSKNCSSRIKWENEILKNEGIVNVFQRESVKNKIKKTLNERYTKEEIYKIRTKGSTLSYWIEKLGEEEGLLHYQDICYKKGVHNKLSFLIEKYGEEKGELLYKKRISRILRTGIYSKLNKRIKSILEENNINFENEFTISFLNEKNQKRYYAYDFKIGNILLEINGDYWHCNPLFYKENDIILFPGNNFKKVKEVWEHDNKKAKCAISNGYIIYTIWEHDITKKNNNEVFNIIKKIIYGESKN